MALIGEFGVVMNLIENLDEISKADIFRDVDFSQLESDLDQVREVNLEAGETLLTPASMNQEIFVLLSGELIICLQADDKFAIAHLYPGDCVGEISLIDDRPPSAYVKSNSPCRLLALHRQVVTRMFERQPVLAANLLKLLAERFRLNTDVLVDSIELQQEYRNKADHDELTGLHNRSWMNDVFPRQLDLSERLGQKVTMIMIDVDHFKSINDSHGHLVGDLALTHLTRVIRDKLRDADLIARFGGEEIVALMPRTDQSQAMLVAEKIRSLVEATPMPLDNGEEVSMTISIGLAEWKEGEEMNSLIGRTDRALYHAKQNGRNQISNQG
jgi:diguanylate cyclase (GGDEF)-like protein